jgi:undecaprenyl-diphosphatase
LATVPALIAGLILHDVVEAAFGSPLAVPFLIGDGCAPGRRRVFRTTPALIGRVRLAPHVDRRLCGSPGLFPGISRSGSTISAGLFRGLLRHESARLSFLMSIPVMLGAAVVGLKDLADLSPDLSSLAPLVVGFVTSAIVGYLVIRWLVSYLASHRLTVFAVYCFAIGIAGLTLYWLRA